MWPVGQSTSSNADRRRRGSDRNRRRSGADERGALVGVETQRIAQQSNRGEARCRATAGFQGGHPVRTDSGPFGEPFLREPGRGPQPPQHGPECFRLLHQSTAQRLLPAHQVRPGHQRRHHNDNARSTRAEPQMPERDRDMMGG